MRLGVALLLANVLPAQLPAPTFPPITLHAIHGGNCISSQPGDLTTDAQKTRLYVNVNLPSTASNIPINAWVTHETWCESHPGGDYITALFVAAGPGACWNNWVYPGVALGVPFVQNFNLLHLPTGAITIFPSHALYQPFNTFYYVGYQIPASLHGYGLVSQWARLDTNGGVYLSALRGYNVQ